MWVKLDDQFWCNRKVRKARESISAYVRLLSWCANEESDGFIPADEVDWICAGLDNPFDHLSVLIGVGLIEEDGDDYLIPDYLEFNYSRSELEERREKDRKRKRPGKPKEPAKPSSKIPSGIRAESQGDSAAPGPSRPVPARPDPSTTKTPLSSSQANTTGAAVERARNVMSDHENIRAVFNYWRDQLDHPKAKLDEKRTKAIKARLADGYTVEDLKTAVDGILRDSHKMGQNDRGKKFDDIELACRTASQVDSLIDLATKGAPAQVRSNPRGPETIAEKHARLTANLGINGEARPIFSSDHDNSDVIEIGEAS